MNQIILAGKLFDIDRDERLFKPASDNVSNAQAIPFEVFKSNWNLLVAWFDNNTGNPVSKVKAALNQRAHTCVSIPAEILEPGFNGGFNYASQMNHRSYGERWNSLALDSMIIRRLCGQLPLVDIAGNIYMVNIKEGMLEPTRKNAEAIPLYSKECIPFQTGVFVGRSFFYDQKNWKEVQVDPHTTDLPENVYKIVLPTELVLDSIGVAEHYGIEPFRLLHSAPYSEEHVALTIPLKELDISEILGVRASKQGQEISEDGRSVERKQGFFRRLS